jgi:lipoate-protein ligase A
MLIFYRPSTNPYLNIAAEEYWVKNAAEDMCMVWVNGKSVIIGKHQNAYAEINYPYVRSHNIPVIRRISGGGAVYHDSGNVNFSFIRKADKTNQVDFSKFTDIIAKFIQSLGIEAIVGKRNSIYIDGQKFSGHAEHLFHHRVLHHGTILFNSDLEALQNSLTPVRKYQSKAMASERSEVVNIAPLLPYIPDIHHFIKIFINWLIEHYPGSKSLEITRNEQDAINLLSESKYKTWEWNFGYSPAYSFQADILTSEGSVPVQCKVENGKFISIETPHTLQNQLLIKALNSMEGLLHKEEEIDKFVANNFHYLELAGIKTVYYSEAFFR